MIETTETMGLIIRLPGLNGALRIWSAARALLALLGLAVVLAAALPAPREALMRQLAAWAEAWDEGVSSVPAVRAGTIQPGAGSPALHEQRAVTEFIAKRYRVAQDATAGFVATAYRVGGEWKVDPLLLLAVMAIESRYNPVAESNMGAKGLMQVIPKFHAEKLVEHGGEGALLDPHVNIRSGRRSCANTCAASARPRPRCRCTPARSTNPAPPTPSRCSPSARAGADAEAGYRRAASA